MAGISVYFVSDLVIPNAKSATPPGMMLNLDVNDTGDAADANVGDGVCLTPGGVCTLRAAIEEAVYNPGSHSISIIVDGTIDLVGPLPTIDNSNGLTQLQISASGAKNLTVRRGTGGSYQVLRITPTFPGSMAVSISGITISNGTSTVSGGGVYSLYSDLTLTGVAFTGNSSPNGSALYIGGSEATISNCTFNGNSGAGAVVAYDTLTPTNFRLENSTITANTGIGLRLGLGSGANAGVTSSTISSNTGNGVQLGGTGGRTVQLLSNIIAGNSGSSLALLGTNTFVSQGYNLASDGGGGYLTATGDLLNTDPLLSALGDYGGMTATIALLRGSPALDVGPLTGAPATDQRGIARVGRADIGAFESRGFQLAMSGGDNQVTVTGSPFANPLSVTITAGDSGVPVKGGPVSFTVPGSGASATIAGNPAAVSGNTATSGTVTANATGGSYSVTATTSGIASPVTFNLRNNVAPTVVSIVRAGASPTSAASIAFTVTLSESVTGVVAGSFALAQVGAAGAAISSVTGSGATWTVSVATGGGTGSIGLNLAAASGITDSDGVSIVNAPFTGEVYLLAPRVISISRTGPNPTSGASLGYAVTFSESVTGLSAGNFTLISGAGGASITGVSGSGTNWTVTVSPGTTTGTIGLNMTGSSGVTDSDGAAVGNLPFVGEIYTIAPTVVSIVRAGASPTSAASIAFTVTFSESLTGGGSTNFGLVVAGTITGTIQSVTGSGTTRTVTVIPGNGAGTIELDMVNSIGLTNSSGVALAGLPFSGQVYTIDRTPPETTISSGPASSTPNTAATFVFSGSDGAGSGVSSIECRLDSGPYVICASPAVYSGLGVGRHTFAVRAIDGLGNIDPDPATYDWVINNQPMISGATITAFAGGPTRSFQIAMVSDQDQPVRTLTVTAVRLAGAGVLIGSVMIDTAGKVAAEIQIDCGAIDSSFRLTVSDALGGQATAILTIQVRQLTASSTGEPTINNRGLMREQTAGCQPAGPGLPLAATSGISSQKPGSLLIFNIHTSRVASIREETRTALTNTSPTRPIDVHLFFVDGTTGQVADSFLRLTPGQTTSFLASEIDPETTGYLIALAVDEHGCPVAFNNLIGETSVRFESGHVANPGAIAVSVIDQSALVCNPGAVTTDIGFNGLVWNELPRVIAIDSLASRAEGNSTMLILNRIGGSLIDGVSGSVSVSGLLYDDVERSASFTLTDSRCQLRGLLGPNFPRTSPRYESMIPAGRSGWMKLAAGADVGLTGIAITLGQSRFSQGHNLHVLTTTTAVVLTVPVFGP